MGYKNLNSVFTQLTAANKDRVPEFGHTIEEWHLSKWGNALAGETGELCNVIKKIERGDFSLEFANEHELIANEAADIVIYLDLLCQRAGVSLQNAVVNKFNKKSEEIGSNIKIYYY